MSSSDEAQAERERRAARKYCVQVERALEAIDLAMDLTLKGTPRHYRTVTLLEAIKLENLSQRADDERAA